MGESLRKNIRRTHEIEFILQKYHRATTCVESFEHRFNEMQGHMKNHGAVYDDQFRDISKKLEEEIPNTLSEIQKEVNSWKRLMERNERELAQLQERQTNDTTNLFKQQKKNHRQTEIRLVEM